MIHSRSFWASALDAWQIERRGRMAIEARQQARLADLLAYARRHSRFYAERYRRCPNGVEGFGELPPVKKAEMMADFDRWVTDPAITLREAQAFVADPERSGELFLGKYLLLTTSGTSGIPGLFVHELNGRLNHQAIRLVRDLLPRYGSWEILRNWVGSARYAIVTAGSGHLGSVVFARLLARHQTQRSDWLGHQETRLFSVLSPPGDLVHDLQDYQPTFLGGYPSAIDLLAREQELGHLEIRPRAIVTGGERLTPPMRRRIQAAFGCSASNPYGASEAGMIAYECVCEHLHVNSDWIILEPVDAQLRLVAPGERSQGVLLTSLANFVQPLIRYYMSDSVTLEPVPCACGSPFPVIRVEGRTDEVLTLAGPHGERVAIPPLAISTIPEELPGVYRYQIVQVGPDALSVRLEVRPGEDAGAVWTTLSRQLRDYLVAQGLPNVAFVQSSERPHANESGKFRHVFAVPEMVRR